jgi:tetratricopeptide (TPR) repeat protein
VIGASLQQLLERAIDLHRTGQFTDAERFYQQVLQAKPDHFDALHMLGVVRYQQGRHSEALDLVGAALTARPGSAWALSTRGVVLQHLKRYAEAVASFDQALAITPDDAEALNNRGNALQELKRYDQALADYDQALAIRPDFAGAHNNRGNVLQQMTRYDQALASYDQALALAPHDVQALHNRGAALQALNRQAEAVASYERALAVEPDNADVQWSESLARLSLGDFRNGWPKFESRWHTSDVSSRQRFPQPLWLGDDSLAGKTILLYAEQGLGDAIQFVRYVPLVAARGGKVVLAVHAELKPLLRGLAGAGVFGEGEPLPGFDLRCPLLSLPLAFGTTLETIPAQIPYLEAPPERLARWTPRLPPGSRRVGLVWSGNPAHQNDRNRSIAFERLAPLLSVAGVQFVSLQKDVRESDAQALRRQPGVVDLGPALDDFADAAAVVSQLDLVITVDTAAAHLAGAMGKPVWILLPFSPDWRWLLDREDSPWYPSARLFRQPTIDDWASVVTRVAQELARHNHKPAG